MLVLLLAALFVIGGTLAYVALRNAQDFSDANEVIPGVPTRAPKEWAGAHSPEARLHRRLRDSMEALGANAALDDPSLAGVRESLQQEALAVDDTLVAVAALPKTHREQPMLQVTEAVEAIEATVASMVMLRGPAIEETRARIDDVHTRLRLVIAAREELAALDPTSGSFDALRRGLEETTTAPVADGPPVRPPEPPEPGGELAEEPAERPGEEPGGQSGTGPPST